MSEPEVFSFEHFSVVYVAFMKIECISGDFAPCSLLLAPISVFQIRRNNRKSHKLDGEH